MPRRTIQLEHSIDYVQILDEKANVDAELEPDLGKDDLLKLYSTMLTIRAYDNRREKLQRQGRIGTFAPVFGQEAAQVGSAYCYKTTDWFVPSFRETGIALWRGFPLANDLLYCAGYDEAIQMPEDSRDMPIAIPIGSQCAHAVGLAWSSVLKDEDAIAVTYIGDGGTSEGDFHEAMNFAAVLNLPVVFFVQNNHWAISVPRHKQTKSKTIAQKALAYGMPGVQVDGNDILGVIHVMKDAVDRARKGKGPSLIEAVTYRMKFHTTADDPRKYRSQDEETAWAKKDPIDRFQKYLTKKKVLTAAKDKELRQEAEAVVQQAVEKFSTMLEGDPAHMFNHAWETNPPYLERQRKEFEQYLEKAEPKEGSVAPRKSKSGSSPGEATAEAKAE